MHSTSTYYAYVGEPTYISYIKYSNLFSQFLAIKLELIIYQYPLFLSRTLLLDRLLAPNHTSCYSGHSNITPILTRI